jgi:hypothetical protein
MNEATHTNSPLTFDKNHMISKGIIQLHEGITISYPQGTLPINMEVWENIPFYTWSLYLALLNAQVFSRSSANRPNIMYRDEQRGTNSRGESVTFGRVIVDCGYTKLFPGTHLHLSLLPSSALIIYLLFRLLETNERNSRLCYQYYRMVGWATR